MNILLHGATDFGSSNFGDYLYGDIVYRFIKEHYPEANVQFHSPSDFFKKFLPNYQYKELPLEEADLFIYIPGGYFGESHNANLKLNLGHFYRFFPIGLKAAFSKKRLVVLGIGAGPIQNSLFKIAIKRICKNADFISVRDNESYEALRNLRGTKNLHSASDLILTMQPVLETSEEINSYFSKSKKTLLVHYNHSVESMHKFAEATNIFIKKHPEYEVLVSSDCIVENETELFEEFVNLLNSKQATLLGYENPYQLNTILSKVDVVLTGKLHMGVVATMFSKSVVSAAVHPGKTNRFYRQIGEAERSISVFDASAEEIAHLLDLYHDKKIIIPENLKDKAQITWSLLESELKKVHAELS